MKACNNEFVGMQRERNEVGKETGYNNVDGAIERLVVVRK